MKIAWLIAPLLLLANRGGSVSAARASGAGFRKLDDEDAVLVTNSTGFIAAIQSARDATNPSKILVDVETVIDFDDGSMGPDGMFLHNKYFEAICVDYDETNKCTFERSVYGGRFFRNGGPSVFSFTGFQFIGGDAESADGGSNFGRSGGVFALKSDGGNDHIEATFIDCDFITNRSPKWGGAIYAAAKSSEWGDAWGSPRYNPTNEARINLIIRRCFFQDNLAGENKGNDIGGEASNGGQVLLSCSETTLSGGTEVDVVIGGSDGSQTCATAVPSSAPSTVPSNAPSVSSAPSESPSAVPSTSPSRFQGWETITYDNFEDPDDGWGNFRTSTDDNELAKRVDSSLGSDLIPNGNAALRIEDDRGWRSSVFHRKSHDVRGYSKLRVRFWYKSEKMEPGDSFVLEYSRSPGNWKVMKRFVRGENFENGELKRRTIDFDDTGRNYGLTSQAKIRFRLDDASPNDFIYIDEVTFQGYVE